MNKNVIIFICAVVVAIVLAIALHAYLQHAATTSDIERTVEELKNNAPQTVARVGGKLEDDDIELWFRELTTVFGATDSEIQKRNIMEVLGDKAGLIIKERREETITLLEKTFDDADDVTAAKAIEVITSDYRHERSAEKLCLIIRGGDDRLRVKMAALEGLGRISQKADDIALLRGYLDDNKRAVLRMAAVEGLAEVRTVNTLKILLNRLIDRRNGAPVEKNLLVRINILLKIGPLGAELKNENSETFKAVEENLESMLRDTSIIALYMSYNETTMHENVAEMKRYLDIDLREVTLLDKNRLEKGVFFATLVALYHLGSGDKYAVALGRLHPANATSEEQAILEDALSSYFEFLLAPNGPEVPLSDVDRSRLLFVCRKLAGLIGEGEATSAFAQENLVMITGQKNMNTKEQWQEHLGKFNESDKKFAPASGDKPE